MVVTSSVPENYIQYVHKGDSVKIDIKSLSMIISGIVSELSPSAYMGGTITSTILTLVVVPLLYYKMLKNKVK